MRADGRTVKVLAVVLLWAGLARGAILHWSPYPATLDGFFYVRWVELIHASGAVPAPIDWDRVVMASFLGSVREVLGVEALVLLQPLSALLGIGIVLMAVVLVRRLVVVGWGGAAGQARIGVALTGGFLALEGLFVRRSGVPDEEILGLLFVPLVAYAFHRWLWTRRPRWGVLTGVVLFVLPATHSLSSTITLLTLGVIAIIHTAAGWRLSVGLRAFGGLLFGLVAALGYYWLALETPALTLSYTDRLLAQPRLLGAWVVLLTAGVVWFVRTSARIQRAVVGGVLLLWVGLLGVNLTTPVYTATVSTPPLLLALVVPLLGVIVAAALGVDRVGDRAGRGAAVLGLFVAPVVLVNYFLTAGLSPDLFDAMLRVQTFAHLPAAVIAGGFVATRFTDGIEGSVRWRRFGRVAFVVVLLGAVLTAPLGVMALDTASIPGTAMPQEVAGTGFAAENMDGEWASEGPVRRIGSLYYGNGSSVGPVATWSRGGSPPDVPVLATPAWTSRGVHQYPRTPARVPHDRFADWRMSNQVVYTTGKADNSGHYFLTIPAR
ncbi:MAG: hypothetical protein ABEH88_07090 [Halobacteriales archaeon]